MKLYMLKTQVQGVEYGQAFLQQNVVAIGYEALGDLEHVEADGITERLVAAYRLQGEELERAAEAAKLFACTMEDGDRVLVRVADWVHVGDLGDYFYAAEGDAELKGLRHRRGVTWLARIPWLQLNGLVQQLLADSRDIAQFAMPLEAAQLDDWLHSPPSLSAAATGGVPPWQPGRAGLAGQQHCPGLPEQAGAPWPSKQPQAHSDVPAYSTGQQARVDSETVEAALRVLREALSSDDCERRERAAIAILQFAK